MSLNANGDFISEDSFMDDYRPIVQTSDGDCVIPDHGSLLAKLKESGLSNEHVWTLIEDDGSLFASPGFHVVNRIGYILTEKPSQSDVVDAIWHDATDDLDLEMDLDQQEDDADYMAPNI